MGQALYRKYRSRSLEELVGQEHITRTLSAAIKNGRISHAYLFTGPKGVGKTSVARILAHQINQLSYSDNPHLDIIEIDAASNRRIDDIRDLRDKVRLAPLSAKYKVYIIDEVHMLTNESFNALLKTLEEPPAHVVFILATTEVHKLPATIISRTQHYSFKLGQAEVIQKHLKNVATQEGFKADDEALALIAEHGDGSFRDSLSLLDQLATVNNGTITVDLVTQSIGLAPKQTLSRLIGALDEKDHQQVASILQDLEKQGVNASILVPQLLRALQPYALNNPALYALLDKLVEVPRAYNPTIKLLTSLMSYAVDSRKPLLKSAAITATTSKPSIELTKKPEKIKKDLQLANKDKTTTEQPEGKALTEFPLEKWAKVVEHVRDVSPALFAMLKHTAMQFDTTTQTLVLQSKYKLHVKRLGESRGKTELAKAIRLVFSSVPIIKVEFNDNVTPTELPIVEKLPLDETAQSVVNIMGGGEPVNG